MPNTRATPLIGPLAILAGAVIIAVAGVAAIEAGGVPAAAATFTVGGVAAGLVFRRPGAWLVAALASLFAVVVDIGSADAPGPFSTSFVAFIWLLIATPGMIVAALVGALLRRSE